jgi:outer membrane immunogenic protein
MKKLLLASVGVLALGVASASAADLVRPRAMPEKAPAYMPPPLYNWSGFYVGINGGYGFGRSSFSAPFATGSFDNSGGMVGGTVGYNYQINQVVLGIEGDMDADWAKGSAACGIGIVCTTKNDWLGTVRGRLGYAAGRFMPYITGGAAFGDIKNSITSFGSANETKVGWTAGGGVEAALHGPWTAKLEYLHVDLGHGATVAGADASYHSDIIRAGINYRF